MPKQHLSLSPNEPPRLELEWGGYMRDFHVWLDGELLGRFEGGQKQLTTGLQLTLPDQSQLLIRLKQEGMMELLEVLRDGNPLPRSASDPQQRIGLSVRRSFYGGLILIMGGLLALWRSADLPQHLGFLPTATLCGVILLFCATQIAQNRLWALYLALATLIAEFLLGYGRLWQAQHPFNSWATLGILLRLLLFASVAVGRQAHPKQTPALAKRDTTESNQKPPH